MEWATVQHLDLRHVDRGVKPLQPHAAAFHPTQALIAVAVGNCLIEFDALTGSKISTIDIGAPVVRMSYSPTAGRAVIAMLEDCTIRSCDFDSEQTCVLHSPERRLERSSSDTEVHLAPTPLQPVVFFGFHKRMTVTVVGTVEGGRPPTKIKTDMKKDVVNLACHLRLPVLYVAYAEGLIRAYNFNTWAVLYTLQLDNTIKLIGAGAFAFLPTLEWIFVGDRRGTLLLWDVSTERPSMIGITQVGSQPISSIAWLPMLRLLVTLSKDGTLQVWKTHVIINPNRPPMQANFFEPAAIESIDVTKILSQNTISSIDVAATLRPPGAYISRSDQYPRGVDSNQLSSNQANVAPDIGLPGGGVPPPATQQPIVQPDTVRLPDGGVPPQSPGLAAVPPLSQAEAAQGPMSQPIDLSSLVNGGKPPARPTSPPSTVCPGQVPRGAAAAVCYKTGLAHLELNQLSDALSCFDEAFLSLAKDQSRGADIKAQATICAQYKIAVALLQEIGRLQRVHGPSAISAKDEMGRLPPSGLSASSSEAPNKLHRDCY